MYKIAVLGDRESVLGFKTLGLDVYPAETPEEARKTLHRLARDGETAIIYLTEQFAEQMQDEVKKYKDMVSLGIGMKNITDSVERAVGADIL